MVDAIALRRSSSLGIVPAGDDARISDVVSNGTVTAQTKKLRLSGLGALMDGVFLSEQLGAEKPRRPNSM